MSLVIKAFHGSPGHPDDFNELKTYLSNVSLDCLDRYSPTFSDGSLKSFIQEPADVYLGYSWGCMELIEALEIYQIKPKKIILISPFITAKPTSPLMTLILKTPFLSTVLMSTLGKKAMKTFLTTSSHPCQPTENYKKQVAIYAEPSRLAKALLEKNIPNSVIEHFSHNNQQSNSIIIAGDNDASATFKEHVEPLQQLLKSKLHLIKNSGHGILFTHPKELGEIITMFIR